MEKIEAIIEWIINVIKKSIIRSHKKIIIKEIKKLIPKTNINKIRYWYDSFSGIHFVEVTPNTIFENDIFIEWELDMYDKISDPFTGEDICFIKKDDAVELEGIDFELTK